MKRHSVVLLSVALILAFCAGAFAQSKPADFVEGDGKTYGLMISTQLADASPFCQGFYAIAKRVEERTGGKMTVKVFPSAQLGSDEDVIEQAIQGVNVAVVTDAGRMANYVRDIGIVGMAYFTNNYDELLKVQQTNFWKNGRIIYLDPAAAYVTMNGYDAMNVLLDQVIAGFEGK